MSAPSAQSGTSEPVVVAVIATHRRAFELGRLLASLERSTVPLRAVVVTDNGGDAATREAVERSAIPHRLLVPGTNLGCGGGLRLAEEEALRVYSELTHVWVLDDDVELPPKTLRLLLDAMAAHDAGAACPMPHDVDGRLGWFPGVIHRERFDVLRRARTPAEYLERCGEQPELFTWATGVALLVSRAALDRAGLHRDDFWMRGEDLDFSLRVTKVTRGVLVPSALIGHLPPGGGKVVDDFPERMKHGAMLQNCAYLGFRTRHGRSIAMKWPGNAWRHLKKFGIGAIGDLFRAMWNGAVCGRPAGVSKGDFFRRRLGRGK
jgi:GT2 family glycosyltransferase